MPEENNAVELKDEELEKVSGGGYKPVEVPTTQPSSSFEGLYCPDCGSYIADSVPSTGSDEVSCPKCRKFIIPIVK